MSSADQIAVIFIVLGALARQIWLDNGCQPGTEDANWHEAEKQLHAYYGSIANGPDCPFQSSGESNSQSRSHTGDPGWERGFSPICHGNLGGLNPGSIAF